MGPRLVAERNVKDSRSYRSSPCAGLFMKSLTTLLITYMRQPHSRRNLRVLGRFLVVFAALVFAYSALFHLLMVREGREHSWLTGLYWTLTVMSTLGFGDITFESDVGRAFSILVLISGTMFMLILLPFTFIQFFYAPWLEAQAEARAPRKLPSTTRGHVILTGLGPVDVALIRKLEQFSCDYVVLVPELLEALRLHDQGYRVVLGELDDPESYRRLRVDQAALVATMRSDVVNTNVAFTVRENSETIPIIATASSSASVDILTLAGCHRVLELGEMMGQSLARRVLGRDAKSHVIGQFGTLIVAEAATAGTPLVGKTLRESRLREFVNLNVVGLWDRGRFQNATPDTKIRESTVLVLAGSREQLDAYDELFCIYHASTAPVVVIGGGRVGRATGKALEAEGIDYRIVEKLPERVRDPKRYVLGDAAELEILHKAGIMESSTAVITTHDDDVNVYLTIYCRRLRPDIQILGRATLDRNVSTLHRAGADFVMSYASMGANTVFNLLQRSDILMMTEGLDVFKVPVPEILVGKTILETSIRRDTGCSIIAIHDDAATDINPRIDRPLRAGSEMILIGDAVAEETFLRRYARR
jgi:voltage-gated potassium channel